LALDRLAASQEAGAFTCWNVAGRWLQPGAWWCGVAARVDVIIICYACVMMLPAARFA
jgi:hypothetical protein